MKLAFYTHKNCLCGFNLFILFRIYEMFMGSVNACNTEFYFINLTYSK